ncbi:MAG TPA: alpha-galactosidase [Jatrophihabitantaceae bacterium]|nr:alpha-galactosidase [Jatrophihabitantaceae bacterium]
MERPQVISIGSSDTGLTLLAWPDRLPDIAWLGQPLDGVVPESRVSILPEHARAWLGRPGLVGHRVDGTAWSPEFTEVDVSAAADRITVHAADAVAGLGLVSEFEALASGAIRARHAVTNTGAGPYILDALDVVVPVPDRAAEILDFTGRWVVERQPQRHPIRDGLWTRENRHGRTGHDAATMLIAGVSGFDFAHGEVWALHVAWSGNSVHRLERLSSGEITLAGGELLLPGEVVLAPGEKYRTPWVYVVSSLVGLDGLSATFHAQVRAAAAPVTGAKTRAVMLNVWEAVYFNHDLDRLLALADTAAAVGVERFVLDDGWFLGRHDDDAGLGDWTVDRTTWPDGLHPLVKHVLHLGMDFGLWWEPEMVNPDSDLYREHPDWILSTGGRIPPMHRNQLVLDLTHPEAFDHLVRSFDALAAEYPISFVKWDHNSDLIDAGSSLRGGAAAVHEQTLAFYALIDDLRRRHPEIEWESCASGGGRIDLEVLERFDSVWTSDGTDPLTRQHIQRWTAQLIPYEFLGSHIAAARSHQTGRTSSLSFRAATALFGQFGIQWNLGEATPAELDELTQWIEIYKQYRGLLHSGRVVRVDVTDPGVLVHGVVSPDRREGLFGYVQLDETVHTPPAFRMPGLDPSLTYRVEEVRPDALPVSTWRGRGVEAGGAALAALGLPAPARAPESVLVARAVAISS